MFRSFDTLDEEVQESYNEDFASLLQTEFWKDLHLAAELIKVPFWERTNVENTIMDELTNTYKPGGDCPSPLFHLVSEDLQQNYVMMHKHICSILYD